MSRKSSFGKTTHASQHSLSGNRCVLYVRASTPEQVNSLDAQRSKAADFARAKDLVIEQIFVDSGVSAVHYGIRERPEARRMFAFIQKNAITTILVLRLDRAFRSSLDFSRTTTEGLEQGFHFRFIEPDIDYGSPMGRMFAGMEALRAEMECELRSQRVDDAYDSLRDRRIARSNHAPYGWSLGSPSDILSRVSRKPLHTLIPVTSEQSVLRHIKQLYDGPGKPFGKLTAIAVLLNSHRVPTKTPAGTVLTRTYAKGTPGQRTIDIVTDGTWKPMTVKSVLAHAVLATDAEMPDGIPTFDQAAAMLSSKVAGTTSPRPSQGQPVPESTTSTSQLSTINSQPLPSTALSIFSGA